MTQNDAILSWPISDENEQWKNIPGHDKYFASSLGRIGSWKKKNPIIMKPANHNKGYKILPLHENGKSTTKKVHRLIAITFIPNPENKPEVNHKNGVKIDNRVENLEWATSKENYDHACINGLQRRANGERVSTSKLTKAKVLKIRKSYLKVRTIELAKKYQVAASTIRRVSNGEYWKHI